jgi:hypothetical protein
VRKLKHYKISFDETFAKIILEEVYQFRIGVSKLHELDMINRKFYPEKCPNKDGDKK